MKAFESRNLLAAASALMAFVLFVPSPVSAQLNGGNILGDTGVGNGTLPPPGFWLGAFYYRYKTDEIRKEDGTRLVIAPGARSSGTFAGVAPTFVYVSKAKILGGNYAAVVAPSVMSGSLEAPGFGLDAEIETGPGDTYIVPLQIGWHTPRADFTTAAGIWAPTGRYEPLASNNTGRGMWSWEASGGTTLYLDPARAWIASALALYEVHSKKKASDGRPGEPPSFAGAKVGDILTLEGGLARGFAAGVGHAGIAYYAQWKGTKDTFGPSYLAAGLSLPSKHRVYGLGPDVTIPIGNKTTLFTLITVRYFWELGAEVKTQGDTLLVAMNFPVPSLKSK